MNGNAILDLLASLVYGERAETSLEQHGRRGDVAQLVERPSHKRTVSRSIRDVPTKSAKEVST